MPTRLAGIQPGYLPWLGYFDQMRRVDVFVIADEMQFTSSGWTHRNRVRGPQGAHWLTLPTRARRGQRIDEVRLDPTVGWAQKHLRTLRHFYRSGPQAGDVLDALEATLDPDSDRLVDVSVPTIRFLAERLGLTTPLLLSSELGLEQRYAQRFPGQPSPTHRIIAFMEALGADELLEGESGRTYLDVELCRAHGIRVEFHDYAHPRYRQLREPFVSHLSAIDLLLCTGSTEARRLVSAAA